MDYPRATTGVSSTAQTYATGAPTPTPAYDESPSKIRDAVSRAEQTMSEIHETITRLMNRLETVLVPAPPTAAGTDSVNKISGSHVLGRLNILNEGLAIAVNRLQDLAQRAEV